nr:MAG TPA: hypothetical protein [Caudoviricetes sp.]
MKNYSYHPGDAYGHEAYCTATGADGREYKTLAYDGMIGLYVKTSTTVYTRANNKVYTSHVCAIYDCDNC